MIKTLFTTHQPVIGMLHLLPLPGAPRYAGDMAKVRQQMLEDAHALVKGGIDGLMLENFGDLPFYPQRVPSETVAHMTAMACELRQQVQVPFGINVLRNDGCSGLAVAQAAGADFIRVNILTGARVTDQGIVQGIAHELLRDRRRLGAEKIAIFADVNVKHSSAVGLTSSITNDVHDLTQRGQADAVIVSGVGTGQPVDMQELQIVHEAAGGVPVYIGSGVTVETIAKLGQYADGFIVGTALKKDGCTTEAVDPQRVRQLMAAIRA